MLRLFRLVYYLKFSNHHFKDFYNRAVNFLYSNISFLNFEAQFLGIIETDSIDFITAIKQSSYLFLAFLKLNWIIDTRYFFKYNLFITISHWHKDS